MKMEEVNNFLLEKQTSRWDTRLLVGKGERTIKIFPLFSINSILVNDISVEIYTGRGEIMTLHLDELEKIIDWITQDIPSNLIVPMWEF